MDDERRPATPEQLRELDAVAGLCAAIWAKQPQARCFAYLRVRSGGRARALILGDRSQVSTDAALLDWERAPLATVFLAHAVDDEYELELEDGRTIEGTVLARALVQAVDRELRELDDGELRFTRGPDGAWLAGPSGLGGDASLSLRPLSQRSQLSSPIEVVLDPVQRRAVELPGARSLLILGEAGFGKTTVALHRVAELRARAHARAAEEPDAAAKVPIGANPRLDGARSDGARSNFRALVLVPTRGLRRLLAALLERLGVRDVEVRTFARWIAGEARRVFPDLPARDSETAPLAVARVKRHPALRAVLPEIIRGTAAMREVEAGYADDEHRASRDPLLHLFGDRALLERTLAAAHAGPGGPLSPRMIAQVLAHTRVQFTPTSERALAHVDAARLATVDGLAIDSGTPLHDADTLDVEDFPVLFELLHLRTGADATEHGALSRYDHIVVDEAQEFAPIELAVIGRALAPGGSITVAGDEHQQVDETIVFTSWPELLAELGVADRCERVVLRESYRCPPVIEAFARTLFGAEAEPMPRRGPPSDPASADPALVHTPATHELELVSLVLARLQDIRARDRLASVAVVCRFASAARRMAGLLSKGVDCRLIVDGDFRFGPGISVTCVDEVKGLEFDYVIIPDASAAHYPNTSEARRALYVAATRALARLWLLWSGRPSPLIHPADPPHG
jgi:DNA helicase II / ATP-dependent DNA helicase PcrA